MQPLLLALDGYLQKYGKYEKFLALSQPTLHTEVVAPQEHIKWIREQEDVLSHREAVCDAVLVSPALD